jgi:cytidylate kinase
MVILAEDPVIKNITVEREFGAGGAAVAQALADRLGWHLWDKQIASEIAKRLKCNVEAVEKREERLDPVFYRLAKVFMRGSYEEHHVGKLELLDAEHLAELSEDIIKDIAAKGNAVLVGRGAPWFLRGRSDTFRVFVYAPFEDKVEQVMKRGKTREEAEDLVETVDLDRAAFVKKYFNKNWPLREIYDVMINSHPGVDFVVDMILSQMDALNHRESKRATLV